METLTKFSYPHFYSKPYMYFRRKHILLQLASEFTCRFKEKKSKYKTNDTLSHTNFIRHKHSKYCNTVILKQSKIAVSQQIGSNHEHIFFYIFLFSIAKTTFSIAKFIMMAIKTSNLGSAIIVLAIENAFFGNCERFNCK